MKDTTTRINEIEDRMATKNLVDSRINSKQYRRKPEVQTSDYVKKQKP